MISINEAKQLAESHLASLSAELEPDAVVIIDSHTIERSFGWVFFYQSQKYVESRNFTDCVVGNAPLIVNRLTGEIVETGTAHPIEHYVVEYEASINQSDA